MSNMITFQWCRMIRKNDLFGGNASLTTIISLPTTAFLSNNKSSSSFKSYHRLALEQSFGFFDNIPDQDWIEYYQKPVRDVVVATRDRLLLGGDVVQSAAQWNYMNWDPFFNCPHLTKVGGLVGGSKWVCDPDRIARAVERRGDQQCLVYSIGSRGNFAFELGLYDLMRSSSSSCEIHIFDFTDYSTPELHAKNIYFHPWGLGSSYSKTYRKRAIERGQQFISFQEMRRRLGHENRTIDLFKIDCEICEWHSYKDWITADLRQILMETHDVPLPNKKKDTSFGLLPAMNVSDFFHSFLEHGFVLFSKEVNSQKGFGRSVEWSFLKLRHDFFIDNP